MELSFLEHNEPCERCSQKKKTRETMCTFSLLVFCLQFALEENGENVCSTFFFTAKLCVGLHLHPFLQKEL